MASSSRSTRAASCATTASGETAPGWFVNDFDGLTVASTHGSPWRYDTHVPLIFMGKGIEPGSTQREVHTVDVAASLSALLGTKPPSGCEGEPLAELFR